MSETDQPDLSRNYSDIGPTPGNEPRDELYVATAFMRGRGTGFIWFVCKDRSRDRILQLANLREMEPGDISGPRAWLHFSGMDVVLEGINMRQVAHRIFLGRCSIVHEICDGQRPATDEAAVIHSISFLVPPSPGGNQAAKPKHEPETERAKH